MEKLKECEPLNRRANIKSYLKSYLNENWKDCDFIDDLVTLASTDVSDAFRLKSFLENGKNTGDIKTLKRDEWFLELAQMFLQDELNAVDAALRGNLSEDCTVPRLSIVQTTHAVFKALMKAYPDPKQFDHRKGVSYADVREHTTLSELEFVQAIEALLAACVIEDDTFITVTERHESEIRVSSFGYMFAYAHLNLHKPHQVYTLLKQEVDTLLKQEAEKKKQEESNDWVSKVQRLAGWAPVYTYVHEPIDAYAQEYAFLDCPAHAAHRPSKNKDNTRVLGFILGLGLGLTLGVGSTRVLLS